MKIDSTSSTSCGIRSAFDDCLGSSRSTITLKRQPHAIPSQGLTAPLHWPRKILPTKVHNQKEMLQRSWKGIYCVPFSLFDLCRFCNLFRPLAWTPKRFEAACAAHVAKSCHIPAPFLNAWKIFENYHHNPMAYSHWSISQEEPRLDVQGRFGKWCRDRRVQKTLQRSSAKHWDKMMRDAKMCKLLRKIHKMAKDAKATFWAVTPHAIHVYLYVTLCTLYTNCIKLHYICGACMQNFYHLI